MAELLEPKLRDRSGVGTQPALVAGSFRVGSPTLTHALAYSLQDGISSRVSFPAHAILPVVRPAPAILTFTTVEQGGNFLSTWTVNDECVPATLVTWHIYGNADGAGFNIKATFDTEERSSTWAKPVFATSLVLYLVGDDSDLLPVTLRSQTVSFLID
jgi:hypothetical protein